CATPVNPDYGRLSNTRTDPTPRHQNPHIRLIFDHILGQFWHCNGAIHLSAASIRWALKIGLCYQLETWPIVQVATPQEDRLTRCYCLPVADLLRCTEEDKLILDDCPNGTRVLNAGHMYGEGHGGISYGTGTT
ncbi:hypothetical protein PSTG_19709, partial [Puccinia striiformis f. sp. tritici PST-78]